MNENPEVPPWIPQAPNRLVNRQSAALLPIRNSQCKFPSAPSSPFHFSARTSEFDVGRSILSRRGSRIDRLISQFRITRITFMIPKRTLPLTLLALVLLITVRPAGAIVFGQLDDFQDGTTMNWGNGANQVQLVGSGGPGGVNDAYMQVTATGGGAGGRLVAQNFNQWLGDYIGAGVTAIEFDLINQGAVTLSIRLAFKTESGFSSSGYLSLPIILAPGSSWQHFSISITEANLTAINGSGGTPPAPYGTFFQNGIGETRIINEAGATNLMGDPVVGQLGIDNIHAIPEPTATMLAAGGLFWLGVLFFRRKPRTI